MKERIMDIKGDSYPPNKAYQKWSEMIMRGARTTGTYANVTVCDEWYTYSVFKAWLTSHEGWENLYLDKDLLVPGNQVYGPDTCAMVTHAVNSFIVDGNKNSKGLPGASYRYNTNKTNPWQAYGWVLKDEKYKSRPIGYFATEQEAHEAWKKSKHARACVIAEGIEDQRIANALRTRYL